VRRAHFLRANHGAKLPDLLIAIDTETDAVPIGPGAVDAVLRFGWLAISARHRGLRWTPPRWHRFTTPDEAWDVIEAAIPDGWTARLVAHNAGFDARVLHMWSALPARGWTCRGAVIEDPPTIVRWRKGRRGIVLLDSLNWYRASPLVPPSDSDPGAARLALEPGDFMVRVPTLVIWGEDDAALLTGCLEGLEACVPRLRVVRVPGASHWIVHERPDLVCSEIERFVRSPGV